MPDRENVIKGLECHVNLKCHDCPYVDAIHPEFGCHLEELIADALTLLREREPVESLKTRSEESVAPIEIIDDYYSIGNPLRTTWKCGKCGERIAWHDAYCPKCGRAVKWDADDANR